MKVILLEEIKGKGGEGDVVNDRRRNANGEWEDYPNYIDCTMFGARAESLSRILTKGMKVAIEGKLRWSQWERDGQKRSKIEVVVDEIELMSRANNTEAVSSNYAPAMPAPVVDTSSSIYDEDIPF